MRCRTGLLVLPAFALCSLQAAAEHMSLQPYSYSEGFEGDVPEVVLWATNGQCEVNFLGAVEDKAFEGKRSLKLDITLQDGSYYYWGASMQVPCEGRLKMTARVLVGKETTASRVGFGTNMIYPPSRHSGCGPARVFDKPTGDWELVEADLVEIGRNGRHSVLPRHTVNLTGDDVGSVLDRWSLFVHGKAGDRVVVYVDDIRIEGEVPDEEQYRRVLDTRYTRAHENFQQKVAEWRQALKQGMDRIDALTALPDSMQQWTERIRNRAVEAGNLLARFEKHGHGARLELDHVEGAVFELAHGPETLQTIADSLAAGETFVVTARRRVITNERVMGGLPTLAADAKALTCAGCRGQYESTAAIVFALKDLSGLRATATPLRGPAGTIPADAVDIRIVKWWYQGQGGIGYSRNKVCVAELLLKDAGLVKVDHQTQTNLLRDTGPDGTETYLICSDEDSGTLQEVRPIDAAELQPVDVAADHAKEFWITIRLPEDAPAGLYEGQIVFTAGAVRKTVPLRVTVHPFDLKPSRLVYSIYYRARLSADGQPTIGSEYKSEEQYRAEIADMKAHGVLFPTNYQRWDETLLRRVLEIRREVGLPGGPFYNLGRGTGNTTDPAILANLQADVRKWIELLRPFGYTDLYFYGIDEAKDERLESQKMTWQAVQEAGGKTFVACYRKTFEAMGALLDCAVLAGPPDPEEAAKWHSVGSHAFCYANPQVGVEQPETYRRNFGLVLWKAGFDGAMNYAYQHGFGHVWNDFDDPRRKYRNHNFTYPTVNGVVGTLQWVGFREGVDDVRYVTTLEDAIAAAAPDQAAVAGQARQWLDQLDPREADLDAVRATMVEWIMRLGKP